MKLSEWERSQLNVLAPLIRKRVGVSLRLSLLLLAGYALYGFLLTGDGALAATRVWGHMTLVIFASALMVVFGVLVAGLYTWWCRHRLDPYVESIRKGGQDD